MDSSTVLQSFQPSLGTVSHVRPFLERPGMVTTSRKLYFQGLSVGGKLASSPTKQKGMLVSCLKTPEATEISNSSDNISQGSSKKKYLQTATFPTEFEDLVLEVCDETEVAEVTLKIGEFEMHMKRNVGATKTPASPTIAPPAPSEPVIESVPQIKPPSPYEGALVMKSRKLLALEASGATGYDFVDSTRVGSFRRGRFRKGKKFPPVCKPGDKIKKGQLIGYVYHFKVLIPVRSDKGGEVLRFLIDDEAPVGYGDHILAILPS